MNYYNLSREAMKQVNKDFTFILQIITKKIEGPKRNVPDSKQKTKAYSVTKYQKAWLKYKNGNRNSYYAMKNREQYLDSIKINMIKDEIKHKLQLV